MAKHHSTLATVSVKQHGIQPIFLPRPCLVPTLLFLLQKRKEHEQDIPKFIDYRIRFVLHFGMVSLAFRNIAMEAASEFFLSGNACFSYPNDESTLIWFNRKLHDSFKPELTLETSQHALPKGLYTTALNLNFGDKPTICDFCAFIRVNDLTLIQKFTTDVEIGPNTCEIIANQMPSLWFLSIQRLIIPTGKIRFDFPNTLSKITYLEFHVSGSNGDNNVVNVSALLELKVLHCFGIHDTSVLGLSSLETLAIITLSGITSCDSLCSSIRPKEVKLECVSDELLTTVLGQKDVFSIAKLELMSSSDLPETLSWVGESILRSLVWEKTFLGATFSTQNYPLLETVALEDRSRITIENCPRLNKCSLKSIYTNIVISSTLYLSELQVEGMTFRSLLHLLSKTPTLRCLEVTEILNWKVLKDVPEITLPCLKYFHLSDAIISTNSQLLLTVLPPLPQLSRLSLFKLRNITFTSLNYQYPLLETLIIDQCNVVGNLYQPNTTVSILKVISPTIDLMFDVPDFLADFLAVEYLILEFNVHMLEWDCILLPPNIRFLSCVAMYKTLCSSLLASTKLEKVSGILRVKDDIERAHKWLEHFTSRRDLYSSLVLKVGS
ncbi:hypothetical protein RCL1_008685 [Eukaryota sp. TZLM3-RCL]